jgi:hypothetical protein
MPPDEREMLQETLELVKENNKMLHTIKRGMFWGRVWRITYWILIIGAAVGAFYFLQPYIDTILSTYNDAKSSLNGLGDLIR